MVEGGSIQAERAIPWARVFVEGFVIVVSILLAFGIDAAWDQHVERREEAEILADLSAEISLNLQSLEGITAMHQRIFDDAGRLVSTTGLLSVAARLSGRGIDEAFLADPRTPGELFAGFADDQTFIDLVIWKADMHWEYSRELVVLRDVLAGIAEELSELD
ncbi:MAG: hypothetical protein ACR2QM_16010 [Longimicrobiales bacterium]